MKKAPVRERGRAVSETPGGNFLHHNLRLAIVYKPTGELNPPRRALRKHGMRQLAALKASVAEFGILKPILIDREGSIIAGFGVWLAATELGTREVPTICVAHLSPEQLRLYAITDNQIPNLTDPWDDEALRLELAELSELSLTLDFDLELTGLPSSQIDDILVGVPDSPDADDNSEDLPEVPTKPATRLGDIWECGKHLLVCGNSLESMTYEALLGHERAQLVVADAPFNVPVNGHVSGTGRFNEFAMASGEMSEAEFTDFLTTAFRHLAAYSVEGSIHYQFIDWRHMGEMLAAGREAYSELKNLLVWSKTGSGGMGTFYRSRHELIFVWKHGTASHINNFGLGDTGRYRTNVLDYPGCAGFGRGRSEDLAVHPTVKNGTLIADLIRDCSKRSGIVLDPFGGAGTTMIAAERTGRCARLIELEPRYCDVTVRRWENLTGKEAVLAATGQTFAQVKVERGNEREEA